MKSPKPKVTRSGKRPVQTPEYTPQMQVESEVTVLPPDRGSIDGLGLKKSP